MNPGPAVVYILVFSSLGQPSPYPLPLPASFGDRVSGSPGWSQAWLWLWLASTPDPSASFFQVLGLQHHINKFCFILEGSYYVVQAGLQPKPSISTSEGQGYKCSPSHKSCLLMFGTAVTLACSITKKWGTRSPLCWPPTGLRNKGHPDRSLASSKCIEAEAEIHGQTSLGL